MLDADLKSGGGSGNSSSSSMHWYVNRHLHTHALMNLNGGKEAVINGR